MPSFSVFVSNIYDVAASTALPSTGHKMVDIPVSLKVLISSEATRAFCEFDQRLTVAYMHIAHIAVGPTR